MIVADSKKLIYVHIYKTGGSTVTYLLMPYITETFRSKQVKMSGSRWQDSWHIDRIQHSKFSETLPQLDKYKIDSEEYLKFIFARNPYSWILSIWNNFYRSPYRNSPRTLKNCVKFNLRKILHKKLDSQYFYEMYPDGSFKSFMLFIDKIVSQDLPLAKVAWGASDQYSFIENERDIKFDFIGKFENFSDDLKKILNAANIQSPNELPHKIRNTNKSKRENYLKYYDEDSIKIANKIFARDFEYFNYEPIKL